MKNNQFVLWFEQVDKHDVGIVGGKGANLGEMTNAHFPIPYGFITTSHAYFTFIKEADLMPKMREFFSVVNYENPHELQQVSQHVQRLILNAPMPKAIEKTILEYYRHMFEKEQEYMVGKKGFFHRAKSAFMGVPTVAVRSSATAEDLPGASFAGQQETYLNVKGEDQLLRKVKECWASLFTERAIYYRNSQGFDHFKVG
jgi:pyruvate,water dikinase